MLNSEEPRKFEVSKRIYDQYGASSWAQPTTLRFRTHEYYVRAGEVFLAALEAGRPAGAKRTAEVHRHASCSCLRTESWRGCAHDETHSIRA
jgi:hypothetical protein